MKTLKKTLCLVLAMVMVFGLCVTSASAKLDAYDDKDDITYAEAVDVMTGIGILAGDARGFRPTDTITRAEAAKIIAYIMIGNATQADALKANSDPFVDVPASHWAAGYISYCATAGIIAGMGDGYHPSDNVTGLAFAKMLLCALGYGQNDEYVGADWAINVSKDALRLGIFDGNTAGANNNAATREECALYAFNVVHGTKDYTGIYKVSYSALLGGYITTGSVWSDAGDANKGSTFGNDFRLYKNSEKEDDFYRMTGHNWYVKTKGNIISGFYADDDNLKATYTTKVTKGEIAKLLGSDFIKDVASTNYEVYINGEDATAAVLQADLTKGGKAKENLSKDATTFTSLSGETGNGTETLVYAGLKYNDVSEKYESWMRIVIVDTYLAKVTAVKTSGDGEITLSILPGYNDDTDTSIPRTSVVTGSTNKFTTRDYKKGDYVLVTVTADDNKIQTVEAVPTVESTVSRYNRTDGAVTLTAGGDPYVAAKNTAHDGTDLNATNDYSYVNNKIVDAKKHTLYIDKYGYLVAVADVEIDSDYVFVSHMGKSTTSGDFDSESIAAKVYYADGTNEVVTVNTEDGTNVTNYFKDVANDQDIKVKDNAGVGIYKITMENGKAILSKENRTDGDDSTQVRKGISRLLGTAASPTLTADSKTVFFYVSDPTGAKWNKDDFTVTAYTGINAVRTSDNDATLTSYITDGATLAKAVLVKDTAESSGNDTVYLYAGTYQLDEDNWVATYQVYVDGETESQDLVIAYETYEKMKAGVAKFEAKYTAMEFFTLNGKNEPITTKLSDGTDLKKINKTYYDSKLTIDKIDDYYFTVTGGDGETNLPADFAWSFDETPVVDVTGNSAKNRIESGEALRDAVKEDSRTVKISVQFDDTTSAKAIIIYVVDATPAP